METLFCKVDPVDPDKKIIEKAGEIIKAGGLVAFPTETVYGLGGDAINPGASEKIYAAKGRPSDNPLIVHIAELDKLEALCKKVPDEMYKLAEVFWPGPLTMIVDKSSLVPKETTGGLDTVAIRMPDHNTALEFIKASGGYIAAPSANTSGRPSPTLASHVRTDLDGRIDMIIDGGEVGIGVESTIVDLSEGEPTILRPGYVTREMLSRVLGRVDIDTTILSGTDKKAPKAPGMKYRHYAPKGSMTLVEGETGAVVKRINEEVAAAKAKGLKCGVLCTLETEEDINADVKKCVGSRNDEAAIARSLYRVLREFDEEGAEVIFSESFKTDGFGQAVMNRLLKAAGYNVEKI
ncbi:MAG: threonylcarbamoyl-AMP synthase [Lachnospiraceae bacterium]|nr:threonylcarbamoyl-AMP synthase [Lachnospiraceae bacterium]